MNSEFIKLKSNFILDLLHSFCELHSSLFDITCDEYQYLLSSDMDKLDIAIQTKEEIISNIAQMDDLRSETMQELSAKCSSNIATASDLKELLLQNSLTSEAKRLDSLNAILKDMIEKIQEQNKRNQVFLNKALHSLNELRNSFKGEKNYNTYNNKGYSNATKAQRG